jgi:integrase
MGNLYTRNGIYWGDWQDPVTKERVRHSLRTRDRAVAKTRLRDFELAHSRPPEEKTQTLGEALSWYIDVALAGRPTGTIRSYRGKARRLITGLDPTVTLRDLHRDDVSEYIARRLDPEDPDEEPAAVSTVYKELVVLRRALKEAGARGFFHTEMSLVVPTLKQVESNCDRWLPQSEYEALLSALAAPVRKDGKPSKRLGICAQRQFWVVTAVQSGARVSELEGNDDHRGIEWQDVDLETGWCRIPGAKTKGAWRRVPISDDWRAWLEAIPKAERVGLLVTPWPNYRRDLAVACMAIGIPRVTANDLRRTFCSWLLQRGETPFVVAKLMGHGSTRMVERIYGQLSMGTFEQAIARLPRCAVFVPDAFAKERLRETHETTERIDEAQLARKISGCLVPRDGIEPPTRGFSDLTPVNPRRRKFRVLSGGRA